MAKLQAECRHFRNFDFRMAVTANLVSSGTLEAILRRAYTSPSGEEIPFGGRAETLATLPHRVLRPGGVSCSGRRVPALEVRPGDVLDVAANLQEGTSVLPHCNKVAIIFAGHPPQVPTTHGRGAVCLEEVQLLGRTTWSEVFFTIAPPDQPEPQRSARQSGLKGRWRYPDQLDSTTGLWSGGSTPRTLSKHTQFGTADQMLPRVEVSEHCDKYVQAGVPECIVAESLWLLRHYGGCDGMPGEWRAEPREFGAAVSFLPQQFPELATAAGSVTANGSAAPARSSDRRCVYRDKADRVRYRAQVEAAIKVCCLLDCDGLVVGCAEGICGSEVFGHPIAEVAEVWREVLEAAASQFRVVAFALSKDTPMNTRNTASLLQEILGASISSR